MLHRRNFLSIYFLLIFVQNLTSIESMSTLNQMKNLTQPSRSKSHLSSCNTDADCNDHGQCDDDFCVCERGWINWKTNSPCSYRQSSKYWAFVVSFVFGLTGLDWFVLCRGDLLYILCGILKFLLLTSCCIWSPLAANTKHEDAKTVASCLSVVLTLFSVVWWLIDWIRILSNIFPDGNGAPLV